MSAEHLDNFAQYGIGQQARLLDAVYAQASEVALVADPDPSAPTGSVVARLRSGGRAFPAILRYVLGGNRGKVGVACRIFLPEIPDNQFRIPTPFSFADAVNAPILNVQVTPTGALVVRSTVDETGAILAQSAGPVLTANSWAHLECWVTFSGATTSIEIRREGVAVLGPTTLPTIVATSCSQVAFNAGRSSNFVADISMYIKDVVIMNGLGTYNTNFVGSVAVFRVTPSADVSLNWTPSTGTAGWSILDNAPAIDNEYIAAGTGPIPAAYVGQLTDLPDDVTSIKAVMTSVRAAKVDGGDGNLQVGLISGAATGNGADRPITAAMSFWRDIFEVDPNTSAPFLPGAFDVVQLRLNRTV